MKKFLSLTLFCLILSVSRSFAQVDVTATGGSPSGSYSTLGAAITAINGGTHTGTITIGISGNTSESASVVLNASGSGSASYSTITISPTGGAGRTISGAITAGSPLIDLSGADNVTFDGINSGGNSLTISNTTASTTSGTSTIRFINGATGNIITKCTIQGSFSGTLATNGGNIFFSTDGTTSNGNDNNTISYCDITAAGSNLPSKCIFMNGSTTNATIGNSGNLIQYNNMYDYFLTSGCAGVYALTGNSDLTVKNNKLYQTATRTFTASGTMHGIYFANSTYGNNIYISDNIIGYASGSGSGTLTLTGSTVAGAFTGITVGIMSTSSQAYINRNTVSDISLTSSTGALTGINSSTSTSGSNSVYVDTNTIANITTNTSTGTLYGINWSSVSNFYARGNAINNITRNTAGTTYGMYSVSSPVNEYLNYNTVSNISNTASSTSTVTIRGIYIVTASGIKECNYNTVYGLSIPSSTATANVLEGIRWNYGLTVSVTGNTIYNLTGVANTLIGFATSGTTGSATYTISKNKIYGLQSTYASSTAGFCSGITISGGTSNTYNVSNNLIGNITATTASNVDAIRGINLTTTGTTSAINLYYNTVYLSASSTGTNFGTSGIYHAASATATTAALTMRNNIIYNSSTAAGTGLVVAFRRSSGAASTLANYASASNNNLFYAGSPSATNVIYYDGTSTGQTMADYKGGAFTAGTIASRDAASVTESMTFQSTTGSNANFLKFDLTTPTQAESGGAAISGYTDDYTGTSRSGSTPDIGAWELSGTAADLTGPSISYTNITNTGSTSNRTLSSFASITDASGVDTASSTRPRIYYKKSTDNNTFGANNSSTNGWKWAEASNTSSPFSFTIDYGIINGGSVTAGDIIQYFVVAQDKATTPNVGASPSTGFAATSVGSVSSAPTTPNSYNITNPPLSGAYDVGASGAYATITAAVADLVLRGVSGTVTFNLIDATYSGSETFPIVISEITGASSSNTITIKPASSVTATITGSSSTSILSLAGADYIIIDGSNNGSNSRDLTISNSSTATTSGVIWISSQSASNGATNNTIKNCVITGNSITTTYAGIFMGGSTSIVVTSTAQTANSNNTISNNQISNSYHGIVTSGTSSSTLDAGLVISNNLIGTASNAINGVGIAVYFASGPQLSGNTIQNVSGSGSLAGIAGSASIITGIYIRNCTNGLVYNNTLYNIGTGIGAQRKSGICTESPSFNSVSTPSNNQFYNNLLYHICNGGTGNTSWGVSGISACGGYGDKFYFNTIQLSHPSSANVNNANGPFAGFSNGNAVQTVPTSNLEFKNNLVILTGVTATTSTSYGHYAYSSATYTGSNISNNRYYQNLTGNSTNNLGIYSGTVQTTLAGWQGAFSGESGTTLGDPILNSTTNLRPQPNSPLLSAGTPVSGITTDLLGVTRNATTPTIGAYEQGLDAVAPVITYTAFTNTSSTSNRTLTATITDATGVPTTGSLQPRIYFRKGVAGTWYSAQGSLSSGSGTNGTWDFTITASTMGGVSTSDTVYYFVIAQDSSSSNNITSNPSAGLSASNVNTVSSAPTSPYSYVILSPLSTSLSVCSSGCSYTTLTASGGLFDAINNNVLGGNTTVTINGDLTAETGAIALTNAGLSGYTLTITPNSASVKVIAPSSDLSTSLIRLNGAAGVTIDGRFSGNGQYLRIVNTHATASSCYPAIELLNGVSGCTIQNCLLESNTSSSVRATVVMGTGTNGLTIKACDLRDAQGTPGTAGVPYAAIYSNTSTNTITVGGSSAADGNNIYNFTNMGINLNAVADGATIQYNNIYQAASRSTAIRCISIATGSSHVISNNSIYQTSGSNTSTYCGIYLIGSGNGHTISNNSIGGSNASRGGSGLLCTPASSAAPYVSGMYLTVGTTVATSIQGNTISNMGNGYGASGGQLFGIYATAGNINIGTATGNTIGGGASAYDTLMNNYDNGLIYYTGTGTVDIENNNIGNVSYYNAGGDRTSGITISGGCTAIIKNNTIHDIKSNSTTTGTTAFAPFGIIATSALSASSNIEGNTIYNIENTNTGTAAYVASGIRFTTAPAAGVTVQRNKIYNIKSNGTGTGTSAPEVQGISITTGSNAITVSNNEIIIGGGATGDTRAYGIYDYSTAAHNYYYNSIYATGTMSSGTNNSYCIYRSAASGSTVMRNNIFYNDRNGSSGNMYAVGAASAILGASNLNYNLAIVPDTAKLVEMPTGTANGWGAIGTLFTSTPNSNVVELNSNVSAANLFNNAASNDLDIKTSNVACWYANGRGLQISGQTADYGSTSAGRSTTLANGGTDIGADEFTPSVNPPDVTVSGSHSTSGTEVLTFAGRTVASITWGSGGTLPTLSSYKYWPGSWPNDVTNNGTATGATYTNAYWVINASGGSGYTYDITLYYDDALLGTIATEANMVVAKKATGTAGTWGLQSTTINTTTNTLTVTGLSSFSEFAGSENATPLPVEWLSFSGKNVFENVVLNWTTASEKNNKEFVIERSTNLTDFETAGVIKSNGNSNTPVNYHFTDVKPFNEVSTLYYRIKQVDFNGEFAYSEIRVVRQNEVEVKQSVAVYPNPFRNELFVQLNNADGCEIRLMDVTGKVWYRQTAQVGIQTIKVSELPAGVYFLQVVNNEGTTTKKIVKAY